MLDTSLKVCSDLKDCARDKNVPLRMYVRLSVLAHKVLVH